MIINKNNLSIKTVPGKDTMAYNFDGVYFRKGETVATDGKMIAICTTPDTEEKEFSSIVKPDKRGKDLNGKGFLVPIDTIKKIEKNIPKKSFKPILRNAQVRVTKEDQNAVQEVVFHTSDSGNNADTIREKVEEIRYPEYKNYIPEYKDNECITIGLDAKQLETIGKLYKQFKKDHYLNVVKIQVPLEDGKPVLYYANDLDTGQELTVCQMPIKLK